jgi:hypothetical protein
MGNACLIFGARKINSIRASILGNVNQKIHGNHFS